ncbi:MAG: hypothetical protein ACP5GJ_00160 [Nanopusillaceae archaeon]|jgi:hypothetical protein
MDKKRFILSSLLGIGITNILSNIVHSQTSNYGIYNGLGSSLQTGFGSSLYELASILPPQYNTAATQIGLPAYTGAIILATVMFLLFFAVYYIITSSFTSKVGISGNTSVERAIIIFIIALAILSVFLIGPFLAYMLVAFGLISVAAFVFFAIAIIIMTTWFKGKTYYHQLKVEHVGAKKLHYKQYDEELIKGVKAKAEVEKYERELKASNKTKEILKLLKKILPGTARTSPLKLIEKRINNLNKEFKRFINKRYPNELIKILDNQKLSPAEKSQRILSIYHQIAHDHARIKHEIESILNYLNNLLNTSNIRSPKFHSLIIRLEADIKNRFNGITIEINKVIDHINQQLHLNLQHFGIIK